MLSVFHDSFWWFPKSSSTVVGIRWYVCIPPYSIALLNGAVCSQTRLSWGHAVTLLWFTCGLRSFAGLGRSGFPGPYFFPHLPFGAYVVRQGFHLVFSKSRSCPLCLEVFRRPFSCPVSLELDLLTLLVSLVACCVQVRYRKLTSPYSFVFHRRPGWWLVFSSSRDESSAGFFFLPSFSSNHPGLRIIGTPFAPFCRCSS